MTHLTLTGDSRSRFGRTRSPHLTRLRTRNDVNPVAMVAVVAALSGALLWSTQSAAAGPTITVEENKDATVTVTVRGDRAPTFQIYEARGRPASSPTYVIELPGAALDSNALNQTSPALLFSRAQILPGRARTSPRVEVGFFAGVDYDAKTKGKDLVVTFSSLDGPAHLAALQQSRLARAGETQRLKQAKKDEAKRLAAVEVERQRQEQTRLAALEEKRKEAAAAEAERLLQLQRNKEEAARVAALAAKRAAQEKARFAALEKARVEKERVEKARIEKERAAEKIRLAALEKKRKEDARLAAELKKKRKAEAARLAALEKKRLEDEARRAAELEKKRKEEARLAALEKKRLEKAARLARLEAERLERVRIEKERAEKQRFAELARVQALKKKRAEEEAARLAAVENARREKRRIERERQEAARLSALEEERKERDRAKKIEAQRIAAERNEAQRIAAQRNAERAAALKREQQAEVDAARRAEEDRQKRARMATRKRAEQDRLTAERMRQAREADARAPRALDRRIEVASPSRRGFGFGGTKSVDLGRGRSLYQLANAPRASVDAFGGGDEDDDGPVGLLSRVTVRRDARTKSSLGIRVDGGARYSVTRRSAKELVLTLFDTRADSLSVRRILDARDLRTTILRVLPHVEEDSRRRVELVIELRDTGAARVTEENDMLWLHVEG